MICFHPENPGPSAKAVCQQGVVWFGSHICLPGKGAELRRDKKPEFPSCLHGQKTKDISGTLSFGVPSPLNCLTSSYLPSSSIRSELFIEQTKNCLVCAGFTSDLQGIRCLQYKLHLELSKITRNSMLSETRNLCSYRKSLTSDTTESPPFAVIS